MVEGPECIGDEGDVARGSVSREGEGAGGLNEEDEDEAVSDKAEVETRSDDRDPLARGATAAKRFVSTPGSGRGGRGGRGRRDDFEDPCTTVVK